MAKKTDAEMAREWADWWRGGVTAPTAPRQSDLADLLRRLAAQSEGTVVLREALVELVASAEDDAGFERHLAALARAKEVIRTLDALDRKTREGG